MHGKVTGPHPLLSRTVLCTYSEVNGRLRLSGIMVGLKILYIFINDHNELKGAVGLSFSVTGGNGFLNHVLGSN